MIRCVAAIVADISPLRGINMDSPALRLKSAMPRGSTSRRSSIQDRRTLLDRTRAALDLSRVGSRRLDAHRMEVEDFDLAENLMIAAG
jgi:hypothetical protein